MNSGSAHAPAVRAFLAICEALSILGGFVPALRLRKLFQGRSFNITGASGFAGQLHFDETVRRQFVLRRKRKRGECIRCPFEHQVAVTEVVLAREMTASSDDAELQLQERIYRMSASLLRLASMAVASIF